MLYVYRQLAKSVGTADAAALAAELINWHDAMVHHTRAATTPGTTRSCAEADGCPHVEARELWRRAQQLFGPDADRLTFLAGSAAVPIGDTSGALP